DFENNMPASVKRYHSNGQVRRINAYQSFSKDGLQQEFDKNGKLSFEVHYTAGKRDWMKAYYWTKNTLRKHTVFSEDGPIVKAYFPDGTPALEKTSDKKVEWFSNGAVKSYLSKDTSYSEIPVGRIETFHESGRLKSFYTFSQQGILDGPYQIFYKSGKQWEQGNYKAGKKEGNMKKWYTNGQLAEDHQLTGGKIEGPFVRYYDNGQLWKSFNYTNGQLNGAYKKWWKNGQLAFDCTYQNNRAKQCKKWNDEGQLIEPKT
ncbi:MAG: hypothetical protein AAFO94_09795, partial [Bacteroidota bacterium]